MFLRQKLAFRAYCNAHRHLYRAFSGWFHRDANRAMAEARRQWGIDGDLVVFSAYNMRSYNDNPKVICEALHAMRPRTALVWIFKDVRAAKAAYDIPDYIRCTEWRTPMSYHYLGRARVVVDNWQKYDWLRLGRGQAYLFSPHHDRSFKHGGFTKADRRYNRMVESRAAMATTGSDFGRRFLALAYHYRGPCLEAGLPRNDILVRDDSADEARIRARLGIDAETGILLFAPTYRDADQREGRRQRVGPDLSHVLDTLQAATGRRWVCLARTHYLSPGLDLDEQRDARVTDVTRWPEMAELLRCADALLTDYSCCAGDFALRGKPIFLYIADIDDYTAHSRALCVDPRDTPYWCARTPDELDDLIRRATPGRAAANCRAVLDWYGTHETGHAAEAAARWICGQLDGTTPR